MIAYKFLTAGARSPFTGFAWEVADGGGPASWLEAPVEPWRSAIHACRRDDLPPCVGADL